MTNSTNLHRYAGILAVLGVSAASLFYIMWRRRNPRKSGPTVKELKDLGNKLFAAKKYEDSIKHYGGYSIDDMLSDCQNALKYNPRYAKAYLRKARLLNMKKEYMPSLVCVYCATQLDRALDTQAKTILSSLLEKLEKNSYESWLHDSSVQGSKKHVRHEKVYNWLHKTVVSDCIRRDVISPRVFGNSPYATAILKVRNKEYDDVADTAIQEDGENLLKSLILAGRFYFYQNRLDLLSSCLERFDMLFNELPETRNVEKQELLNAKYILCIEAGRTYHEVKKAFTNAVENADRTNADFYVMAAVRYVLCNEPCAAMEILSTEGIYTDNVKLLQLTLQILNNFIPGDRTLDMGMLHRNILDLENFVSRLEPKTGYALSALAKITATFSSDESARLISEDVLRLEPNESIHYYDRSCMAASCKEGIDYLEKCLAIEPYHAEANLMLASLLLNEIGARALTEDEYEKIEKHNYIALSTFDDNIDFPVLMGVFRLREILLAKKEVSKILGS
ncbi:unnamed protein product [Angiostrongylus costaricensis]|uniref:TPR_REGION domain-containing protein n=1 Tax=Angiostrongylus costaricensis TaxID=334426 RepID=A0A0R3PE82_ANGCS|nr:unnamed protein product [Angiostrongylus costaricensis]